MGKRMAILLLLFCLWANTSEAQRVAQKTDLLGLASTTPNYALELAMGFKWSMELSTGYNPWDWKDDMSLRHWLVRAEPRIWFCDTFLGMFMGVHGFYGKYKLGNISFIPAMENYFYDGFIYGAGITLGWHFYLGPRWGLELAVGGGYARLEYNKYLCEDCLDLVGDYRTNYFGPTRLSLSLVFLIK